MNVLGDTESMRILVVDDNAANVSVDVQMLTEAGYSSVSSTLDPEQAVTRCVRECPDLLVLDLHMPRLDGFGVMKRLDSLLREPMALPVLVMTADVTVETRLRALTLGARDFVTKPLDQTEFLLRVHNLLQTRHLQLELQARNGQLATQVDKRTASLQRARLETLERLGRVSEYRDYGTYEHAGRIGRIAEQLALELGLPPEEAELIGRAAPLHDIGKIGIPDRILLKSAALTDKEWVIMKRHTTIGAEILSGGTCPILGTAEEIARCHHERLDGKGYPHALAGEEIPYAARIVAVVDVFDALTHDRPYKRAWPAHSALHEIRGDAGHFDPGVVAALDRLRLMEVDVAVRREPLAAVFS